MFLLLSRFMNYATVNPYNNQVLKEFPFDNFPDLSLSTEAFNSWKKLSVEERGIQ